MITLNINDTQGRDLHAILKTVGDDAKRGDIDELILEKLGKTYASGDNSYGVSALDVAEVLEAQLKKLGA